MVLTLLCFFGEGCIVRLLMCNSPAQRQVAGARRTEGPAGAAPGLDNAGLA